MNGQMDAPLLARTAGLGALLGVGRETSTPRATALRVIAPSRAPQCGGGAEARLDPPSPRPQATPRQLPVDPGGGARQSTPLPLALTSNRRLEMQIRRYKRGGHRCRREDAA